MKQRVKKQYHHYSTYDYESVDDASPFYATSQKNNNEISFIINGNHFSTLALIQIIWRGVLNKTRLFKHNKNIIEHVKCMSIMI